MPRFFSWKPTHSASDVIVFVVGGGNYVEYQNIIDYSKNRGGIQRITYGCTEMVNPLEFSRQVDFKSKFSFTFYRFS